MPLKQRRYKNYSDEQLLELIQQNDTAAFDVLYQRYSRQLLNYFYRMLSGERNNAQDLLQDIFIKIIEKPERVRNVKKFSAWLFTVAHNMVKNEYRSQKVRDIFEKETDLDAFDAEVVGKNKSSEQIVDQKLFESALLSELSRFDELQRSTFLLKYQEQFTIKEISQILDCSEGTTKSRLFYTTKKLADRLNAFNPNRIEVK